MFYKEANRDRQLQTGSDPLQSDLHLMTELKLFARKRHRIERRLHDNLHTTPHLRSELSNLMEILHQKVKQILESKNRKAANSDRIYALMKKPIRQFYYKNEIDQLPKIRFSKHSIEKWRQRTVRKS